MTSTENSRSSLAINGLRITSLLLFLVGAKAQAELSLDLATGPAGSTYHKLGQGLAKKLTNSRVRVKTSRGSIDNLNQLRRGDADLAIVQGGLAAFAAEGKHGFAEAFDQLRLLSPLHVQALQVVVRKPLRVSSMQDLRGKKVANGLDGSGTQRTSQLVFELLGFGLGEYEPVAMNYEEVQGAFLSRQIDAAVFSAGAPNGFVKELLDRNLGYLLPLEPVAIRRMQDEYSFFSELTLGAADYPQLTEPHTTLGIPALLLTTSRLAPATANQIRASIRRDQIKLQDWAGVALHTQLTSVGIRPHESLSERPMARDHWPAASSFLAYLFSVILFVSLCLILFWRFSSRRLVHPGSRLGQIITKARAALQDHSEWIGPLALALSILLLTFLIFLAERRINEHFSTWTTSLWSIVVYLASGFEDRVPLSRVGRAAAIFIMLSGPIAVAWLTALLASSRIKALMKGKTMPRSLSDHYVLCHWNELSEDIIRELHQPVILESEGCVPIVILADPAPGNFKEKAELEQNKAAFRDVYLHPGNPTDIESLRQVNAHKARCVVFLSRSRSAEDADASTILGLAGLNNLCKEEGLSDADRPHVVAELVDERNKVRIEQMSEFFQRVEALTGAGMRSLIISQGARTPGLVHFFYDLARNSEDSNEVYALPITETMADHSFAALRQCLATGYSGDDQPPQAILVGYQRGGRVTTNPRPEDRLQTGDCLVFIALDQISAQGAVNWIGKHVASP